jgi:hypothetical protein
VLKEDDKENHESKRNHTTTAKNTEVKELAPLWFRTQRSRPHTPHRNRASLLLRCITVTQKPDKR